MGYLDLLAAMLRDGAQGLGEGFRTTQAAWLETQQLPDGGFPGRSGPSDVYYTDFALRALELVAPESPAFARAADWLVSERPEPRDLVGVFAQLSCWRTLGAHGLGGNAARAPGGRLSWQSAAESGLSPQPPLRSGEGEQGPSPAGAAADRDTQTAGRRPPPERWGCPSAALARGRGRPASSPEQLSAYATFLGTLCREMLDEPTDVTRAAEVVRSLRREDGGFAERPGEARSQTNATAAAIALLVMAGGPSADEREGVAGFLAKMQANDGGLRAHAAAPEGDLLSTFTGLLTLLAVADAPPIDVPALARFVRAVARPGGGFGACPSDAGADVEYAYYGIATLALLRTMAGER